MAAKSTAFNTALLELIFTATPIADIAADDQSSPATQLTVALHTATPNIGGSMTTNETAYTNYVRKTVARTSGGWTVSGASVQLAANCDFAECGATPGNPITHFSIGTGVSDNVMYFGTVTPNITMAAGVIPRLKTGSNVVTES